MTSPVFETRLALPGRRQGKVRDLYELPPAATGDGGGTPRLLIVACDRVSAFDVVMPTPIPGKGALLTDLSLKWFDFIRAKRLAELHLLSTDVSELVGLGSPPMTEGEAVSLRGRIMIVRRCRVVPIECVVRGYLDGSGWLEYQESGSVCGVRLPAGLRRGDKLPEPIFTPATKEEIGVHDQNISFERAREVVHAWSGGRADAVKLLERMRDTSVLIYAAAHEFAAARGLILADTKFEFGVPEGSSDLSGPMLVDEALTPDSSRYWDAAGWKPGGEQPSYDKQFLREYLNRLTAAGQWNKQAPGPQLPHNVVEGTRSRYEAVRSRLFGP